MKRNLTEEQFNEWKTEWLKEKGCPFFTCSQAAFRKVCGNSYLCGFISDYKMYKNNKWIKVCDVKLAEDDTGELPTKICAACTSSMCLKVNHSTGDGIGISPCKLMNNYYERKKYKVDRKLEKYILSWGAFFIPIVGEKTFLEMANDPDIVNKIQKFKKENRKK